MSDNLTKILDAVGYAARPEQRALFEHLIDTDHQGVVAQAGTGVGKSFAVLAAAATFGSPGSAAMIVVPNNTLLNQYQRKDGPVVEQALGIRIATLRGRSHYLCAQAPGFDETDVTLPDHIRAQLGDMRGRLDWNDCPELTRDQEFWGCPGSKECDGERCCYADAKYRTEAADVIITNAHLFILDIQLKGMQPIKFTTDDGDEKEVQPAIFGPISATFVDEAHQLEGIIRDFDSGSIPLSALRKLPLAGELAEWIERENNARDGYGRKLESRTLHFSDELTTALRSVARHPDKWVDAEGKRKKAKKHQAAAIEAAADMLKDKADNRYQEGSKLLWFDPAEAPRWPRLVSSAVDVGGVSNYILTRRPFGLVSATVPSTMQQALGVRSARFIDVGHPFDYARQASINFSRRSGAWSAVKKEPDNETERAHQVMERILDERGGSMVLFSSFADLEKVYGWIQGPLRAAGKNVLRQEREGQDRTELGEQFKTTPNAVLFASSSFGTGFDAPGDALTLVVPWKLPFPGLDPLTKAISDLNRQRYTDMMLVSAVQMIGRLIRSTNDKGHVFIPDSRARYALLNKRDPMLSHLNEFQLLPDAGM